MHYTLETLASRRIAPRCIADIADCGSRRRPIMQPWTCSLDRRSIGDEEQISHPLHGLPQDRQATTLALIGTGPHLLPQEERHSLTVGLVAPCHTSQRFGAKIERGQAVFEGARPPSHSLLRCRRTGASAAAHACPTENKGGVQGR